MQITREYPNGQYPSGKCKSKPQLDATLYPPEWLIVKQLSVGEGVEQQEISYTVGGCTNWYNKLGKLFDSIY